MSRLRLIYFLPFFTLALFAQSGEQINYTVSGKQYQGYFEDAGPGSPLILLVHDWDGLTDYEIKRSKMLKKLGYSVFAVDLYGAGIRPVLLEEKKKLSGELYSDRKKMRKLLQEALSEAKAQGADTKKCVAIGYCFGGSAVMELARSGEKLRGFVSFHGGLELPEGQNYNKVKGEILVFHGSADKAVPFERFAQMATDLESAGIKHEMITYSGADHAFSVFESDRYHPEADKKSWNRFIDYLDGVFGSELDLSR